MAKTKKTSPRQYGRWNKHYQQEVLFRMFNQDEDKMQEFHEEYLQFRQRGYTARINEKDRKIANDWRSGMTTRELSQKYKMKQSLVDSRIKAVAKHYLRTDEI